MPKTFVVTHTCLILPRGNAMNGTVLSEADLQDVDVERLLRLDAIAVASDEDQPAAEEIDEAYDVEEAEEAEETEVIDEVEEAEESGDQPEVEETIDAEAVEETEETFDTEEVAGIEVKTPPLTRMNRAQLLGVMADLGISPENEDKINRVQMIEAIKQAQTDAAD